MKSFLLFILFILFIIYLIIFTKNSDEENIKSESISSKMIVEPIKTSFNHKQSSNPPIIQNQKWMGVQRNPVCCRIHHMNQNFYDSEFFP